LSRRRVRPRPHKSPTRHHSALSGDPPTRPFVGRATDRPFETGAGRARRRPEVQGGSETCSRTAGTLLRARRTRVFRGAEQDRTDGGASRGYATRFADPVVRRGRRTPLEGLSTQVGGGSAVGGDLRRRWKVRGDSSDDRCHSHRSVDINRWAAGVWRRAFMVVAAAACVVCFV
jgi:hypothetical protein